jgi:DNA-binding MarR family transcriptional regulator
MNRNVDFKHISVHEGPEKSPGFLLWHISTTWRAAIEAVLKPLDLTHPQFVVLATLGWLTRNGDRVSQAAIGSMAGLDPNTTSQIIRGLEAKKLVKRVAAADVRSKNPLLTSSGSAKLTTALPAVEQADAAFFQQLTEQETTKILILFQKLAQR